MNLRTLLLATLLATSALAGCTDKDDPIDGATLDNDGNAPPPPVEPGKGAVSGLLIDDRFRPLADGTLLLQELGRTTRSNANGEFRFIDLAPGTYTLKATVEGHEARPQTIEVPEGAYAEVNVVARRTASEGGTIITQEYSVFIPCAADYVVNGGNYPCTLDFGDDGYGTSFQSNLTSLENVTYVITEMKANQENGYEIQLRAATDNGTHRYAVAQFRGDYVKIVNRLGERNLEHEAPAAYGENVPFNTTETFDTILFVDHGGREELQSAWPQNPGAPTWFTPCCGIGVSMGIEAKFVQSIFIGEPEIDITTYAVYS